MIKYLLFVVVVVVVALANTDNWLMDELVDDFITFFLAGKETINYQLLDTSEKVLLILLCYEVRRYVVGYQNN